MPPRPVRLEDRDGVLVAVPEGAPPPPLTAELVRDTLERVHRLGVAAASLG